MNYKIDRPDFASFKPFEVRARAFTPHLGDPKHPLPLPSRSTRPKSVAPAAPSYFAPKEGDTKETAIRIRQHLPRAGHRASSAVFRDEPVHRPGSAAPSNHDVGVEEFDCRRTHLTSSTSRPQSAATHRRPPSASTSTATPNAAVEAHRLRTNDWFHANRNSGFESHRLGAPLWKATGPAAPVFGSKRNAVSLSLGMERRKSPKRTAAATSLTASDLVVEEDSDEDGVAIVSKLTDWQPRPTDVQHMARSIVWKYRTANHSRTDSVTVWDYLLEKRMNTKDPRVVAEMTRFQNLPDPDRVQSTAAAVVAEALGLDDF